MAGPGTSPWRGPPRGGISVEFGPDVTDRFCEGNGIDLVVRSHQYVRRGYKYMHAGRLVTLFSARNYFGREENDAALLMVASSTFSPSVAIFAFSKLTLCFKNICER